MKTYTHEPTTSNPDIERVVDRSGNWQHYFIRSLDVYVRGDTTILNRGFAKGPEFEKWLLNHTPEEAARILSEAGDRGDAVHQAIRRALSGEQVDRHTKILAENNRDLREFTDSEWDCMLAFGRFWTAHQPVLIAHEATVAYLQHDPGCPFDGKEPVGKSCRCGSAGTLDFICRPTKACDQANRPRSQRCCNCEDFVGKLILPDWKTSSGIHANYGAQVAIYAASDLSYIFNGKPYSIEGTGIVRLGTNHKTTGGYQCEFYDHAETLTHLKEFFAAKTIDDATYKPFDPAKEIRDIPETLSITVEREEIAISEKPKKPRKPRVKKAAAKSTKKAA